MSVTEISMAGDVGVALDEADARLHRRLRVAGVAVLVAAALGSVWTAAPLGGGPLLDRDCVMQVAGRGGFSSGCADAAEAGTAR